MRFIVNFLRRHRRIVHGAGTLLAIGLIVYAGTVVQVLRGTVGTAAFPVDCAIVFGAAVHPVFDTQWNIIDATSGPGIRRRVATAARLYKAGQIKKVFVTGGKADAMKKSEATVMAQEALEDGVSPDDLVLEGKSSSTVENLRNTQPLTKDCHGVIGISDGYHLARIEFLAKKMDWDLETYPADADPTFLFLQRSVLREALAILWYSVVL